MDAQRLSRRSGWLIAAAASVCPAAGLYAAEERPGQRLAAPALITPLDEAPLFQPEPTPAEGPAEELLPPPQATAAEETCPMPPQRHPWARFEPGAWRRLRIVSEAFDASGVLTGRSIAVRRESLEAVGPATYTLRFETTVDMGGKQLPAAPQRRVLSLVTDQPIGEGERPPHVEREDPTAIALGGQSAPCVAWRVQTPLAVGERVERVFYCATQTPYVLRRERALRVDDQEESIETTIVTRAGVPKPLGDRVLEVAYQSTESLERGGRKVLTFAAVCDDVPGGLVEEGAIEIEPSGSRSRRTTTAIVGWGPSPLATDWSAPEEDAADSSKQRGPDTANAPAAQEPEPPTRRGRLRRLRRLGEQILQEAMEDPEGALGPNGALGPRGVLGPGGILGPEGILAPPGATNQTPPILPSDAESL